MFFTQIKHTCLYIMCVEYNKEPQTRGASSTSQTTERKKSEMGSHSNNNLESFVKIPTIKFTKLFINGEFVDSISGFQLSLFLSVLWFTSYIFLYFSYHIFTRCSLGLKSHFYLGKKKKTSCTIKTGISQLVSYGLYDSTSTPCYNYISSYTLLLLLMFLPGE